MQPIPNLILPERWTKSISIFKEFQYCIHKKKQKTWLWEEVGIINLWNIKSKIPKEKNWPWILSVFFNVIRNILQLWSKLSFFWRSRWITAVPFLISGGHDRWWQWCIYCKDPLGADPTPYLYTAYQERGFQTASFLIGWSVK